MKAVLAIGFLTVWIDACTSQEVNSNDGGHGGTGVTGGTGGGASGGSAGYDGTLCLPIKSALITDFTYSPDAPSTAEVRWGDSQTVLSGGEAKYPDSLTSDVTGSDWHLSGTVGDYAGFNVYFDHSYGSPSVLCNKFDASAYQGISYTIWGTLGTGVPKDAQILFGMGTVDDTVTPQWLASVDAGMTMDNWTPGHCVPTSGNGPYYHPGCGDPTAPFTLTGTQAAPQTVSVKWSDFKNGMPVASVNPTGIVSIYWQLPVPTNVGMPTVVSYAADIHIDNIKFIEK